MQSFLWRTRILMVVWLALLCAGGTASRAEPLQIGVFLRSTGHEDPAKALDAVKSLGVDLIQVSRLPDRFYTPQGATEFAGMMKRAGVRAASVVIVFDGESYKDRDAVEKTVGFRPTTLIPDRLVYARRVVDFARAIGSSIVTFHVGFVPKDPNDPIYQSMLKATDDLARYAGGKRVTVSLETGQETAEELEAFLDRITSARVGVNFDTANLVLYGMDAPPAALKRLLRRVTSLHIKDGLPPADGRSLGRETRLGEGRAGVSECLRILREAKFEGPLIIENYVWRQTQIDPLDELRRAKAFIERENERMLPPSASAARPASPAADPTPVAAARNWPTYLGDKASTHYSTLDQIDRGNVGRLQVAWTYETGDKGEFQTNNLVVDGVLYTASSSRKLIALNAATGEEVWRFDPKSERDDLVGNRQRGLVYWDSGEDRRLFTSAGSWLYAIDARTGTVVRSFGANGSIHLGTGLERDGKPPAVRLNTPGVIYKDLLILGGLVSEQTAGAIRAFDLRTGELRWIFRTIPRPGEFGYDTWPPDAWKTAGAASDWSGHSVDEARGIVYVSTETAGPDFWGGDRFGANLFANSLIALDANTGKRLWHYQIVHHDLWDLDLPCPPTLLRVTHNRRRIDAVAQGTKQGLLFVFDRVTGAPLWPIHERPIPRSRIPGVQTWPTQPFPEKPAPLMRQLYTSADVSDISPDARALTTERFARGGSFGAFPPPSLKETILFPGPDGGFEWGGTAADPNGVLYANINEIPWFYQMIPTRGPNGAPVSRGERQYLVHCASCHGMDRKGELSAGLPPLLNLRDRFTAEHVMKVVVQGGGRMPPFAQVPEAQRRAVVDFLFGTERPAAADAARPGADGPEREGPPYAFAGFRRWFDREGYPAIKPPWGTLNAIDLNTGEIKWKVPLGEYAELTERGIPPTGTENYGGPVVTAGGLIFIGATADETFRAFDKDTGTILWQAKLPFSATATPSTYLVNGKQYVVISAGGGKSNRPAGGSIVAFALPD
jgi:quinoprotein glucose dehydrogenase